MARCNCSPASCSCSISAGCGINTSGIGTVGNPFVFSLNIDVSGGLECGVSGLRMTRVQTGTSTQRAALTSPQNGDQWTDTDTGIKYERYGGSWVQIGDCDGYTTYTPRMFVGVTGTSEMGVHGGSTFGNGTRYGRFTRSGRACSGHASFLWGSTSSFGSLTGRLSLELAGLTQADMALDMFPVGDGFIFDNGTANFPRNIGLSVVSSVACAAWVDNAGVVATQATPIAVFATGDRISINYHYELAS